jgi:DNA-binding transcriptional ArsR family regulator
MDEALDLSRIAKLFASTSRAAMLLALADGRALPAGELAFRAGISNQTASEHLSLLKKMGIVSTEPCGRHRYYRIVNRQMMETLEDLLATSFASVQVKERSDIARVMPLREARLCYDHLAGRMGVALAEAFLKREWFFLNGRDFSVTEKGRLLLPQSLHIDWKTIEASRRLFARRCIDWSERKPHIGGALGAALAKTLLERDWIRRSKESRSVYPTREGRKGLQDLFGIHC